MIDLNEASDPGENVHPLPFRPNVEAMRAMVLPLFRAAPRGLVELAWTSDTAPHPLNSARLFGLEDLDDLVSRAAQLNETPNRNVYVSAGLRNEDYTDRDKRAQDVNVVAVTAIKADFDKPGALDKAWKTLKTQQMLPNMLVITGHHPHTRGQMWWVLDEPCNDLQVVREIERRIAIWLGGDQSIVNPSRVMRLAGSVAWPLKAGRKPEVTELITRSTRPAPWTLDELKRIVREALPLDALAESAPANPLDFNTAARQGGEGILPRIEKALQGDQWHNNIRDAVAHAIARGTPPDIVVDLMAPLVVRAGYTIEETRRDIATMTRGALNKGFAPEAKQEPEPEPAPEAPTILHELWPDIEYHYEPELVEELFPRVGLGTIYGPSTVGKSFVTLDWASTIATGRSLFGRDTDAVGVLYLAFEGYHGLKKRIAGIKQEKGLKAVAFELVDAPWVLTDQKDWQDMRAHIEASRARLDETGFGLGILVVDTLTSAYAGSDANSQADVTRAMKRLKRLAMELGILVLVIGHTGKDENRGMVGSFAYKSESDTFIELQADKDELDGRIHRRTVFVEKVKDGASEYALADYELREIRIGTKPNGKPINTCVVDWKAPAKRAAATEKRLSKSQRAILQLLQEGPKFVKELVEQTALKRPTVQLIMTELAAMGEVYSKDADGSKLWYVLEKETTPND